MKSKKSLILILILLMVIAIIFVITLFFTTKTIQKRHRFDAVAPVIIQKPTTKHFTKNATAVGTATAKQQTFITARINGYISKILFTEGQRVKANTPLIQLDNAQIKSQLAADSASSLMAEHTYTATKKLTPKGYASTEELEQAFANYQAKLAAVIADKKSLSETTIRAPFDGRLGEKTIHLGDYVTAAEKLVQIVNDNELLVSFTLPEKYEPFIKLGQKVAITLSADPQQKIQGEVTYISPEVDSATRTIALHATIDNKTHRLMSGEYVGVTQYLGETKSALFIPEQAVIQTLNGATVFIVKDKKAKQVKVKTGPISNGQVEIRSGLTKADEVVIAGQYRVKDRQTVKITK